MKTDLIHKAMNNINTFQCCEGELYLRGTDEFGNDLHFINWKCYKIINNPKSNKK